MITDRIGIHSVHLSNFQKANHSIKNSCENFCELLINKTVIPGKKFPKFSVTVKNPILPTYRPTCWSTHHRRVGRHTTDASTDTLPTRGPIHYRRIDRNTYVPHLLCRHVGRPVGRIGFLTFTKFRYIMQGCLLPRNSGKFSSIRHRKFRKQQTGIFGRM